MEIPKSNQDSIPKKRITLEELLVRKAERESRFQATPRTALETPAEEEDRRISGIIEAQQKAKAIITETVPTEEKSGGVNVIRGSDKNKGDRSRYKHSTPSY